jgi:outer membrane translocation and assembly module TamA
MMIMIRLEELAEEDNKVKVRWFYPEDDEDLEEAGHDFEDMVELSFEFIPYDDDEDNPSNGDSAGNLIDSLL